MVNWGSLKKLFGRSSEGAGLPSTRQFAIDLHRALRGGRANLVFSPESIRMALGMALVGARGPTAAEIEGALRVGADGAAGFHAARGARLAAWEEPGRPYALAVANGFFHAAKLTLRAEAASELRTAYRARVEGLDFEGDTDKSRKIVNQWASATTRGLIPEIVSPGSIRPDSRLVIANALYFKGAWAKKFGVESTVPAPFSLSSGEKVQVPTMHQTGRHRVWGGPEAELLEMAYLGGELAMTFVLPPKQGDLGAFEAQLREGALGDWLSRLDEETVRVAVPRFEVDLGYVSLRPAFVDMGVVTAFDGSADFGGFSADPLSVDDVAHRARIKVTEEGTEAAAATALFAAQGLEGRKLRSFRVDSPFVFLLRDVRDGAILFMGRVSDPRAS